MVREEISTKKAFDLCCMETEASNIRGLRPIGSREDPCPHSFDAAFEWAWACEAHVSVTFKATKATAKKSYFQPVVKVNWPACARSPIEGRAALQLYDKVVDLACRLEVMLGAVVIVEIPDPPVFHNLGTPGSTPYARRSPRGIHQEKERHVVVGKRRRG